MFRLQTHSDLEGVKFRSAGGGLRYGEMDRDCSTSHHRSSYCDTCTGEYQAKERLADASKNVALKVRAKELRAQGRHLEAIEEYEKLAGDYHDLNAYNILAIYHDPILAKGAAAPQYFSELVRLKGMMDVVKTSIICYLKFNENRKNPYLSFRVSQLTNGKVLTCNLSFAYLSKGLKELIKSLNAAYLPAWEYHLSNILGLTDYKDQVWRDYLKSLVEAATVHSTFSSRNSMRVTVCDNVLSLLCCDRVGSDDSSKILRETMRIDTMDQMNQLINSLSEYGGTSHKFYLAVSKRIYGSSAGATESHRDLLHLKPEIDLRYYYHYHYHYLHLKLRELSNNYFLGRGVERDLKAASENRISSVYNNRNLGAHLQDVADMLYRIMSRKEHVHDSLDLLLFLDACGISIDDLLKRRTGYGPYTKPDVTDFAKELSKPSSFAERAGINKLAELRGKKDLIVQSHLLTADLMLSAASYLPWFKDILNAPLI
jgi:hypothetical protein